MKERIINNWKTTVFGLGIIVVGAVALFLGKVTGTEFTGFVTTAVPFIWGKNTLLGFKEPETTKS